MPLPEFKIIGVPDNRQVVEFLTSGEDVCFGKFFSKGNPVCTACRAPVQIDGKIVLMKELCAATQFKTPGVARINRLTSQEVLERLERNTPVADIFFEILGDCPPEQSATEARVLLQDRLTYLKKQGAVVPDVPRASELVQLRKKK